MLIFCKPRATLCVFSHAKIEIKSSKGVHCSVSNLLECSTKIKKLGSLNNYQPIR